MRGERRHDRRDPLQAGRRAWLDAAVDVASRWLTAAMPLLAFLVATAATLLRQIGVPKVRTIWAEDATIFAGCAYAHPTPAACLLEPYNGWIHVVPRLGAQLAVLAPPEALPLALASIAAIVTGLAAATVSVAVRNASESWVAGLLAGASLALTWQAGREVGGSVTNLEWILLAAAIIVIVASWAGHRAGGADVALVVAAGLSTAFAPVLPALGVVGVALRRPRAGLIVAAGALAAAVQVIAGLTNTRTPPGQQPFDPAGALRFFARDVIDQGPFGAMRTPPGWAVAVGVAVVGAIALARILLERRPASEPSGRTAVASDAAKAVLVSLGLVGTGVATFAATVVLQRAFNPRYTYVAAVLLCCALVFSAALVGRGLANRLGAVEQSIRWAARLALPIAAILLVVGFGRSFFLEARASNGPDVVAEYRAAATGCSVGAASIRLPVSPVGGDAWAVEIPCDRVRSH